MLREQAFIDQLRAFRLFIAGDHADVARNQAFMTAMKAGFPDGPLYIRALRGYRRICLIACLRTAHNNYVRAEEEEHGFVVTGSSGSRKDNEAIALVHDGSEIVNLRTWHNTFVTAEDSEDAFTVIASRKKVGGWEKFYLLPRNAVDDHGNSVPGLYENQRVALATTHGTLVSAEDRRTNFRVIANRPVLIDTAEIGIWERFTLCDPDLEVLERLCSRFRLNSIPIPDVP